MKKEKNLNFIYFDALIVAKTTFNSNSCVTCKSFNAGGTIHQIDHVIVNKNMMNVIEH